MSELSTEDLTERFYLVREQRDKLLWASQKALAAHDSANNDGKSTWTGRDVDEMKAAVANCSSEETNADLEEIDGDALLKLGFTGGNDEHDTDVYDRMCGVGLGGPIVRVVIRYARGEQVKSHLMLVWDYQYGNPGKVSLRYEIADHPTRGEVRRLCESLGIETPVTRTRCSCSFSHPPHDFCDGNPDAKPMTLQEAVEKARGGPAPIPRQGFA